MDNEACKCLFKNFRDCIVSNEAQTENEKRVEFIFEQYNMIPQQHRKLLLSFARS